MTYIHITWLANRLRNAGLDVITHGDWQDRGRPTSTGGFNPVGVLMHHTAGPTATDANGAPSLTTVINGRSDLPGPLCHVLIGWQGACHIIAAGRANHAGEARASGPVPAGDGNDLYVGIEIDYAAPGQHPSQAQRDSAYLAAAAIVTRLGHGANYVRAHRETCIPVGRKIDPSYFVMDTFRSHVSTIIKQKGW